MDGYVKWTCVTVIQEIDFLCNLCLKIKQNFKFLTYTALDLSWDWEIKSEYKITFHLSTWHSISVPVVIIVILDLV